MMDALELVDGVLEGATTAEADGEHLLELRLQPWSNLVRALREKMAESLVV